MRRTRSVTLTTVLTLATGVVAAVTVASPASAAPCGNQGILGSSLGGLFGSAFTGSSGGLLGKSSAQGALPSLGGGPTQTIRWITGPKSPNHTDSRFGITGTDLGIGWDNGSGQTLMAFGDTFGDCNASGQQWRHNVVLRTTDKDPSDGVDIAAGVPGDVRSGASVSAATPRFANEALPAVGVSGAEVTTIPTAAIAIDGVQYMNIMSVRQWGAPGRWVTNYSILASSRDNGQTWTTDPRTIRLNTPVSVPGVEQIDDSNGKYQVSAYLKGRDGFIYQYGTPNGRFGAAFLCRFAPGDIADLTKYTYWDVKSWSPDTTKSVKVVGEPVGEMSVAWNDRLQRYVMLHGRETDGTLVLRTATAPQGPWSAPVTLLSARQSAGVYAPYIYPVAGGDSRYLYFTASRWADYNVMMLRTDLTQLATT
ncbi:DUF4185 domain-containing protein [Williamsia deligens]|uniref:DUF4185 domain-containing protein n=1 Tax=Williamsia deligens TaxID=321325 RepID=A0ABW3G1G0_9NOCA|nr:DUF4185 domain-containing protein [Williamsia deligens]MCP2194966.1 protein of unknown function (DUF4185) [Williamsia deligens]